MPLNLSVLEYFKLKGATLLISPTEFADRFNSISSLIFDWDGVFTSGYKKDNENTQFSETDSAGIHLFRFAHYLDTNSILPCFIITGQNNSQAEEFASRESFTKVYKGIKNKVEITNHINKDYDLKISNAACFIDDYQDFSLSKECGIRFFMNKDSIPWTVSQLLEHSWADYITATKSGNHVIRECFELMLSLHPKSSEALQHRINMSVVYKEFLFRLRN